MNRIQTDRNASMADSTESAGVSLTPPTSARPILPEDRKIALLTSIRAASLVGYQDLRATEINQLPAETRFDIYHRIREIRNQPDYRSSKTETQELVQFFASLLGLPEGKIFARARESGISLRDCSYHMVLEEIVHSMAQMLQSQEISDLAIEELNALRERALQTIGVTMDQIYVLLERGDQESFIRHNNSSEGAPATNASTQFPTFREQTAIQ